MPRAQRTTGRPAPGMFEEGLLGFSKSYLITDSRLINFTHQTAMQLSNPKLKKFPSFRFPASMPITAEKRHIYKLKHGNYMFTPKADGTRILLLFFTYYVDGDWRRMCVALYREGECQLLVVETPTELNERGGSLFDCELVQTTSGWYEVLLFDCYSYMGSNMRDQPLLRRFAKCEHLSQVSVHRETNSVKSSAKPYYKISAETLPDAAAFLNNCHHYLHYATDGIVLAPPGKAECFSGPDETQFKMKLEHTVDLILIEDDDDARTRFLATYDESDDSYFTKQEVSRTELPFELNSIVECKIAKIDGINTYVPVKVRPDKTKPNSERVLERTLQTLADNVTLADIVPE